MDRREREREHRKGLSRLPHAEEQEASGSYPHSHSSSSRQSDTNIAGAKCSPKRGKDVFTLSSNDTATHPPKNIFGGFFDTTAFRKPESKTFCTVVIFVE
jgi:hypothetical protein